MVRIFTQLLMLPMTAFVSAIEAMVRAMQDIQQVSNRTMEVVAGSQDRLSAPHDDTTVAVGVVQQKPPGNKDVNNATIDETQIMHKEETALTTSGNCTTDLDKDLRDDMLKLVRYKVLFVRREYEVAFPEREDLVSDNMEGSAFTAWKIAEFIQELSRPVGPGHIHVPQKWIDKNYAEEYNKDGYLTGIPHEDKKYLRVYFEVLERYPREKFKYEEQQIRVLEEIRDKLPTTPAPPSGGGKAAKP